MPEVVEAIELVEAERRRIARALHDDIAQELVALRHLLDDAQAERGPVRKSALADGIAAIDRLIERIRDFAFEVRSTVLDELGLACGLRELIERRIERAGIAVTVAIDDTLQTTPVIATACYRIAQEALSNVVRHAAAKMVRVSLADTGALELAISDDGIGFDLAAIQCTASLGLIGMRERATLAGGALDIDTRIGGGTTVRARFPRLEPR